MDYETLGAYLTEKTGIEWKPGHVEAVFGEDADETDPKVYCLLEDSMRNSLPPGLFDEVEQCARVYAAVEYAALNGELGGRKGFDGLCRAAGQQFLKYWGPPGKDGAMKRLEVARDGLYVNIDQSQPAGFNAIGKQPDRDTALIRAIEHVSMYVDGPTKGMMAVKLGQDWYASDGINPNTGKDYTPDEVALLNSVFGEVLIAS